MKNTNTAEKILVIGSPDYFQNIYPLVDMGGGIVNSPKINIVAEQLGYTSVDKDGVIIILKQK